MTRASFTLPEYPLIQCEAWATTLLYHVYCDISHCLVSFYILMVLFAWSRSVAMKFQSESEIPRVFIVAELFSLNFNSSFRVEWSFAISFANAMNRSLCGLDIDELNIVLSSASAPTFSCEILFAWFQSQSLTWFLKLHFSFVLLSR